MNDERRKASATPAAADALEREVGEALLASLFALGSDHDPSARRAASALYAALVELRATTATMRGDLPPVAGLADAVGRYAKRYGLAVELDIEVEERSLHRGDLAALIGIAREALANASRHGGARTVHVAVTRGQSGIRLVIDDDGSGLTAVDLERARSRGELGIAGMEGLALWRHGAVTFGRSKRGGLRVEASLPGAPPTAA